MVDTPPAQHALDFLEAPERLLEFLDSRLVQLLSTPPSPRAALGFRLFQRGARRVLKLIERVSGIGFLEDISEFLLAFEGMSEGFRERARAGAGAPARAADRASCSVAGPGRESAQRRARCLERLEAIGRPRSRGSS